ncbi:serine/threonine-protein kinase [Aliarcobacter butzleri]|uniref:serine/threonine-protein kinase n=1 Tax=Aliarcobacter butzleri TaxID=28197 RepID=UPI00344F61B6
MIINSLKGKEQDNQYINFEYLTQGGMGYVYKAFDNVNNHEVVVKFIAIPREEVEDLLSRELIVSEELSSPNLVKTYYCDKTTINNNDYFYIVQKYYQTGNLRNQIQKNIPYDTCIKMFLDLLNGLKTLHTKIIHRDLKPENILIDNDNNLLITDFGLAKFIGEKTKTRSFKGGGTYPYMSPECWLMQENQIQMDIYSLGIIFYEILTGEFPFNGQTEQEWQTCHIYDQLPNLDTKRSGVPTKIKQIISKMTNKRTKDRYANVEEIINVINQSIEQEKANNIEIEKLAALSHLKSEEIKQTRLKQEQERNEKKAFKKFVDYHISELKVMIKEEIEKVNERIEDNHITFKDHKTIPKTNNDFSLSLNNVLATFKFFDYETIQKFEEDRYEDIKQSQIRKYGGLISHIDDSIYKKKNIIFIGRLRTNYQNPELHECFGFNLILVQEPGELYGDWYIASFYDSGLSRSNRKNFGLDSRDFLHEFPLCFITHTMSVTYEKLHNKHIHRVIEEVIKFS